MPKSKALKLGELMAMTARELAALSESELKVNYQNIKKIVNSRVNTFEKHGIGEALPVKIQGGLPSSRGRSEDALLQDINKTLSVTIVVITHEMRVIDQICDRVAVIDNSRIAETGAVSQVFSNPQSEIARELILPGVKREARPTKGGKRIRIVFDGGSSYEPVIANLVLESQAAVNILFADTKDLQGKAYGHMILELPSDKRQEEKVLAWLEGHGVEFREEV